MTPEQVLSFIEQGTNLVRLGLDPIESMHQAQEEHILCDGDTPADAQEHYFNTGLTIIKSAIDVHLRERRRDAQSIVGN